MDERLNSHAVCSIRDIVFLVKQLAHLATVPTLWMTLKLFQADVIGAPCTPYEQSLAGPSLMRQWTCVMRAALVGNGG